MSENYEPSESNCCYIAARHEYEYKILNFLLQKTLYSLHMLLDSICKNILFPLWHN